MPLAAVAIGDALHDRVLGGGERRERVGRIHHRHRLRERDGFAAVGERPAEAVGRGERRAVGIEPCEGGGIARHDQIAAGRDAERPEDVVDAAAQLPAVEVHALRTGVEELDVLLVLVLGDGVVHDLVEHDRRGAARRVGRARRGRLQNVPARVAVGKAAVRDADLLVVQAQGVDHMAAGGGRREEPDGVAAAVDQEAERGFVNGEEASRREFGAVGKEIAGRTEVVAFEHAAAQRARGVREVVQLDEAGGRAGVGQHLVDQHGFEGGRARGVRRAGRAAGQGRGGPAVGVALAVGGTGEDQGVARAVGGGRPRRVVAIRHRAEPGAERVMQRDLAAAVEGVSLEAAHHLLQAGDRGDIRRRRRHDEVPVGGEHGAGRECVVEDAGEAVAAEILIERVGIVQLDEAQVAAVAAGGGRVADLGDGDRGAARGGAGRFAAAAHEGCGHRRVERRNKGIAGERQRVRRHGAVLHGQRERVGRAGGQRGVQVQRHADAVFQQRRVEHCAAADGIGGGVGG